MVSTTALWIGWDIAVAALGLYPATESRILLVAGYCHVVGPAALGFVLGHIAWPAEGKITHRGLRIGLSVGYFAVLLFLNVLGWLPKVWPILPLVIHLPLGRLGWPQTTRALQGVSP